MCRHSVLSNTAKGLKPWAHPHFPSESTRRTKPSLKWAMVSNDTTLLNVFYFYDQFSYYVDICVLSRQTVWSSPLTVLLKLCGSCACSVCGCHVLHHMKCGKAPTSFPSKKVFWFVLFMFHCHSDFHTCLRGLSLYQEQDSLWLLVTWMVCFVEITVWTSVHAVNMYYCVYYMRLWAAKISLTASIYSFIKQINSSYRPLPLPRQNFYQVQLYEIFIAYFYFACARELDKITGMPHNACNVP